MAYRFEGVDRIAATSHLRIMLGFLGVPVTNAMRTILDVWKEGSMPHADLREAFREAVQRGAITRTQIAKCKEDAESAPILAQILKGRQ